MVYVHLYNHLFSNHMHKIFEYIYFILLVILLYKNRIMFPIHVCLYENLLTGCTSGLGKVVWWKSHCRVCAESFSQTPRCVCSKAGGNPCWALAGAAQWLECWLLNQSIAGLIPSQGTCLGCRPRPWWWACKRHPHIDVSLPSFSLPPSLSKNI